VISKNTYIVSATVDDTEIDQVKADQQAVITPSSSTSAVYGTVSSVGMIATSSSGVASYPVTINVTGHPTGLHAGSNASVSIIVKQLTNVLTVPAAAVHVTNGKSYVTVVSGGKTAERAVTTGASSGGQVQIASGLTAGQQVQVRATQAPRTNGGSTGNQNRGGFGGGLGGGGSGTGGPPPGGFTGPRGGGVAP
jgi:hypothetical protein